MKSVGRWKTFKGAYVYYFNIDSTTNRKYWSTARIENGVLMVNYYLRTPMPVDCSSTYRRLKVNLRDLFYAYESDRRLLIIEPLSKSKQLFITNVQLYCHVKGWQDILDNIHLMSQVESMINNSMVFYSSIEEYLDLQRLKHNEEMRVSNQSKREDDYTLSR